jgi:UDP-N-acetylglucosamine--N-acetylmuramyl-(pentapeptide) pyrophosphoryl-undecaprenol N-acetylglucosamine transferase
MVEREPVEREPIERAQREGTIVIAGGGTGGHVVPGLAVARALVAAGTPAERILFVGSARGIEAKLVPDAGFEVVLLTGRGIQRRLTWENLGAVWGLIRAFFSGFALLARIRPRAVVSLGGYASVAASASAVLLRIPVVVTEQNARAGLANRIIGRFAAACAVPFHDTDLPRAVVTGNPVRPEILARGVDRRRDEARAELGVADGRTVIAVFAGSLGATSINAAVAGLVRMWADRTDLHIHHVLGARDWDRSGPPEPPVGGLAYSPVRFEDRMDTLLAAADLAVCRSGGTTVAELTVVGVPAVLVPFPQAPGDHQTANAQPMVRAGAAVVIPDGELDPDRLAREVGAMLGDGALADHARLEEMAEAAKALGRPDAAERVAELVECHATR